MNMDFALVFGLSWLRRRSAEALPVPSMDEAELRFERDYLTSLLAATRGNRIRALRAAQLSWREFHILLRRHRLDPAAFR